MTTDHPARPIRDQIWEVVDPDMNILPLLEALDETTTLPGWMAAVHCEVAPLWTALATQGISINALVGEIEHALTELVPRGWAVFNMQTAIVNQAVNLVISGEGDMADELLADQWDSSTHRTKRVCDRVSAMGTSDATLHNLFQQRARLLRQARKQHDREEYAASIQMVHSQIEGIATDVTANKKFFSSVTSRQADVVNRAQLVSIEASLAALRSPYIAAVEETQADGSISRHAVAHGRELAYDTRVVSAKAWSLLDAIVEWALPLAREEADTRRARRQTEAAGSVDVDESGRRIDDREFSETCETLRFLASCAMGWWSRENRLKDDFLTRTFAEKDFIRPGLPTNHGIEMLVTADGQCAWFWRRTISGWTLGIAIAAQDGSFSEWLYAGPEEPSQSPMVDELNWSRVWDISPDWRTA
ncbi:hypothetical protein [Cryobacterium sp. Y57]|uniref:hypothetical protein n=1 Tax=Cryobacterium sp. Y57 TaxID=2048287 RepID=UPI000CE55CD8|nr:hypothetical protein [Cryobacterium sp. Y57]